MFKIFFGLICLCSFSNHAFSNEWGTRKSFDTKETTEVIKPYHVLSLDGGGVRGVFSAQLLAMLEEEFHFLQHVDLFVGTSTGSILACALAYGIHPNEIVDFYRKNAKDIFEEKGGIYGYFLMQAKYERDNFEKILKTVFSNKMKLSDLPKKVICVSFELRNPSYDCWTPALIDNFNTQKAQEIEVVDAILRSAAAPTYFSSYQGFIDGGAVANNPSMMALAKTLDPEGAGQPLESIRLLSVGTGIIKSYIPEDVDWGAYEWLVRAPYESPTPPHPLFDILYNGTISVPHFQCSQILGSFYQRLNAFLSRDFLLDDWKEVDFLISEAINFPKKNPEEWEKIKDWVRENFLQ
ncbi:MAG: patatin-like phospholipase family protein [Parachlamydiales bacterium]|jgi:hypothetical protein